MVSATVRAALTCSTAVARSAASAVIFCSSSARLARARRPVLASSVRAASMGVSTLRTAAMRVSMSARAAVSAWAGWVIRVCSRRAFSVRVCAAADARVAESGRTRLIEGDFRTPNVVDLEC